jgi:2-aminobenzoate-CoA ligase
MIITSGFNVEGPEVEDALMQHAAVAECGVVGLSDEERGMVVKAFVVRKPGVNGNEACVKLLQDHLKAMLVPF